MRADFFRGDSGFSGESESDGSASGARRKFQRTTEVQLDDERILGIEST
jgi:hypothetical protein